MDRLHQFDARSHFDLGRSMGSHYGSQLTGYISRFLVDLKRVFPFSPGSLEGAAHAWLSSLPQCYLEELEGIAMSSGCPLHTIAQWYAHDQVIPGGCTSFLVRKDDGVWVGRNNDYILPQYWGYATGLRVRGRHPVVLFGLMGESFSGTGCSGQQLWLHYNWLPADDWPSAASAVSPFVLLRLMLEQCSTLADVEHHLSHSARTTGMTLSAVDGKTNDSAVFQCTCQSHRRWDLGEGYLAAANHSWTSVGSDFPPPDPDSVARQKTVEDLLEGFLGGEAAAAVGGTGTRAELAFILAHPDVEQNRVHSGTVYSTIAWPQQGKIWYGSGGFPAASQGSWRLLRFPPANPVSWGW